MYLIALTVKSHQQHAQATVRQPTDRIDTWFDWQLVQSSAFVCSSLWCTMSHWHNHICDICMQADDWLATYLHRQLYYNRLTGSIPGSIGNLSSVTDLYVANPYSITHVFDHTDCKIPSTTCTGNCTATNWPDRYLIRLATCPVLHSCM
jgi:hypothetical protein